MFWWKKKERRDLRRYEVNGFVIELGSSVRVYHPLVVGRVYLAKDMEDAVAFSTPAKYEKIVKALSK